MSWTPIDIREIRQLETLQAENAALKEQVASANSSSNSSMSQAIKNGAKVIELREELAIMQARSAALEQALDQWLLSTVNDRVNYAGERAITRAALAV